MRLRAPALYPRAKAVLAIAGAVSGLLGACAQIAAIRKLLADVGLAATPWWVFIVIALILILWAALAPNKNDQDAGRVAVRANASHGSQSVAIHTFEGTLNVAQGAVPATPETAASDFRVEIENLTVDRHSRDNPTVLATISVTNYGERAAIDRWQMLYWFNGQLREAGEQPLQDQRWCLEELRFPRDTRTWGYSEYIGIMTKVPIAKGETRHGFFYAELCDSAAIQESDLRTVHLQFRTGTETIQSLNVGANLFDGHTAPRQ